MSSPDARPDSREGGSPSAGELLRSARERAGWPVDRLAAELCLPVARLRALEADEYDGFGGSVFVRGYLRRAASVLGMPPQELVGAFDQAGRAQRPDEVPPAPARGRLPRRGAPAWGAPLAGVLAIAAALGLTWWFIGSGPEEAPVAEVRGAQRLPALEFVAPAKRPAADPVITPEVATVPADTGVALEEQATGAHGDVLPELRVVELPEPAALPPGSIELRFEFSEDCWVEVTDAQERQLAYRLYRAGEVARMRGTAPVAVFLGNAEGVRLTVDDAPIAVRPAARRDGTARLTVGGGAG